MLRKFTTFVYCLCLLCLNPITFAAQNNTPGTTRYLVTTDHLKPEMMTQWRMLQKNEVLPALKKAGVTSRKVYHTVVGDTTAFISYLPFPDYSLFDGPDALEQALGKAAADNLKQRLNDCLFSSSSHLEISQDEFFLDPVDAPVLFSSSYRATAGNSNNYLEFLRAHMQSPIQRAVDTDFIQGFQVMITDQGGEVGIYILNMFYPNFDTLDQGAPAAKMMGPDEMADFFRAGTGLIERLEQFIHSYEKDISF